jgi:hypothetical protein
MFHKLTIDSITARAVLVPMPRPLRTAAGDVPAAPLVLVDVQTNEGSSVVSNRVKRVYRTEKLAHKFTAAWTPTGSQQAHLG